MNKVYIVVNYDSVIFGIFSKREQADFIYNKMNKDYPNDGISIEVYELNTIKSWIISKELDDLGINVEPN
tara:strand:+ start:1585 stop:1794 length:210 start_codon:yes stop_codon:yes gene_type:complete